MRVRSALAAALLSSAGFSTIETAGVMAGSSILAATATPQINEYLESARTVKATGDVRVIAISLVRLTADVHRLRMQQKVGPHLLVSDGETPAVAAAAGRDWTRPLNGADTQPLAAHLVSNEAAYPAGGGLMQGRWRGPYMQQLSPDPWGVRYAANVGLLERPGGHTVMVISAGPNRTIETPFEASGLQSRGDDVISLVGRGR